MEKTWRGMGRGDMGSMGNRYWKGKHNMGRGSKGVHEEET